ncbi:Cof-type HAD-IIB family hydrolase [Spiroplasma endosymbiont of Megaselia nigra]|uniref:Cof-type HAD-IIB family hydrolase n=1 Tax=Spiroplasma endosymbiont of Megaselia nigra TaxID=2478537 RepID=UPI000F8743C9|nr:Cof-type HAD-IIB family hydrolase [Spiroplasma endosymbiont of Megaselia nigra]RUO86439.1 Cof-type HAD-IIB family hydrolase [Spiroplasma endosymbiont of Megaselia nigra]
MKKAVFSDLDGTLLKDNHRFSRLTKKTVNSIQKKGISFVVTTGRLANDAIRQARKLKVHKYDGYVLANNGASAYSFKTNSFLWMMIFTTAEIKTIFDFTYRKYKVHFFSNNSTYVYEYGENSYYWSKIMRTKYKIITKVADIIEDITHASVIAHHSLDDRGASELMTKLRQLLPQLYITQYNNRVFEIACKGISKGSALQFLSYHIGIDISQTYSFGDSYNDLELIRQAGVGIAVSNAIDELKTMANEVTLSNRENGPAKYLQQFFLKK